MEQISTQTPHCKTNKTMMMNHQVLLAENYARSLTMKIKTLRVPLVN